MHDILGSKHIINLFLIYLNINLKTKISNMKTKKIILTSFLLSVGLIGFSQLNPIKNLSFSHWYVCPNNFFKLEWSPPDSSLTDTLVGYNIYRDTVLYRFYTNTIISRTIAQDTTFADFINIVDGFSIHVTAVYNSNHVESIYNDSARCGGILIKINEYKNETVSMYPNPFNTQTTLQLNRNLQHATLSIYNTFGQEIKQINTISGQSVTIERNNLPCGWYILKLTEDNKIIAIEKLLITN